MLKLYFWIKYDTFSSAWAKGLTIYFGIFHDWSLGSNLRFQNPNKLLEGKYIRVWTTLGSGFLRYRVMVNYQGVMSRKNYVPHVTSKVTKIPIG